MCILDAACIRYAILVKDKISFYNKCLKHGVDMGISFNHVAYPEEWCAEHKISSEVLNLPFYYNLTAKEQNHIIKIINSIIE